MEARKPFNRKELMLSIRNKRKGLKVIGAENITLARMTEKQRQKADAATRKKLKAFDAAQKKKEEKLKLKKLNDIAKAEKLKMKTLRAKNPLNREHLGKVYTVYTPTGKVEVKNLSNYCRLNKLSRVGILKGSQGYYAELKKN